MSASVVGPRVIASCKMSFDLHAKVKVHPGTNERSLVYSRAVLVSNRSTFRSTLDLSLEETRVERSITSKVSTHTKDSEAIDSDEIGRRTLVATTTYRSLDCSVPIAVKKCNELGRFIFGSSVTCVECLHIGNVVARVYVYLSKCCVVEDVYTSGPAFVFNSRILGTLAFTSARSVINRSSIGTIKLGCPLDAASSEKMAKCKQVLELRNCSVGNVIFEGNDGEVILSGKSCVTGTITGGILKRS